MIFYHVHDKLSHLWSYFTVPLYREYAKEVLEVLGKYVPGFLINEDFYDKMEKFDIAA